MNDREPVVVRLLRAVRIARAGDHLASRAMLDAAMRGARVVDQQPGDWSVSVTGGAVLVELSPEVIGHVVGWLTDASYPFGREARHDIAAALHLAAAEARHPSRRGSVPDD